MEVIQWDADLVKSILLAVKAAGGNIPDPLVIEGYTSRQINYHSNWLINDSLIKGLKSLDGSITITGLTDLGNTYIKEMYKL